MRTIQLIAGTCGAFYCQNCLRDFELADAHAAEDQAVEMVPLYLPLTAEDLDDEDRRRCPRFFGGINVFLQQKVPLFAHLPRWSTRWLDAPWLLRWAGRKAELTSASQLGQTTISMLEGEHGRQGGEVQALATWLAREARPDLIAFSSALLLGLSPRIRSLLPVPQVCFLQDEDGYLDDLPEPYRQRAWELLIDRARDIDRFITVSGYYRTAMAERLAVDPERIEVIDPGLDFTGYDPAPEPPDFPTIGFLSPALPHKGLGELVEILAELRRTTDLAQCRLHVLGGTTAGSRPFLDNLRTRIRALGLDNAIVFAGNPGRPQRQDWLRTVSVLCVPEQRPEALGMYVLEANACGVPVVEPHLGGLSELVTATGGGELVPPGDRSALSAALSGLLRDSDRARRLGHDAAKVVRERYRADRAALKVREIYARTVAEQGASPDPS
jgi:glycosyltransferase involved in cell wall biosynthesis